jgi:hypothetical protein
MILYNYQRNAQVFNSFIYLLLPYMFRAFFLAHLQRQVYNFGSGSSLLFTVSAPGCWHRTPQTVHYVGHCTTSIQFLFIFPCPSMERLKTTIQAVSHDSGHSPIIEPETPIKKKIWTVRWALSFLLEPNTVNPIKEQTRVNRLAAKGDITHGWQTDIRTSYSHNWFN